MNCVFVLALAFQSPPATEIRTEFLWARLDGSMKFDEKPAVGDRVGLRDDLGFHSEAVPRVSARFTNGSDRYSVSLGRLFAESEATMNRDRRWNESIFAAGEEVRSRIDLFQGELGYERRVFGDGGFDAWAGIAARYLRLEAVLKSASQGTDDDHIGAFTPIARLAGSWAASPQIRFDVEVEAAWWGVGDVDVRGGGAGVSVSWRFTTSMSVRLGWRAHGVTMDKGISLERNDLRLRTDSLLFGLEINW